MAKPERELGDLLNQFQAELDVNMPARRKLFAVANRFIQARKISAQVSEGGVPDLIGWESVDVVIPGSGDEVAGDRLQTVV